MSRRAFITGGAHGIGKSIVEAFASRGDKVAFCDIDAAAYFRAHFQEILGETFRPYDKQNIFSLALDKSYPEDNSRLFTTLSENFYVIPVDLGEAPSSRLETERAVKGSVESRDGVGKFLTFLVCKEETGEDGEKNIAKRNQWSYNHKADGVTYAMLNMPDGDISEAKFLLPIIDNTIDGYCDIERISFGTRTKGTKDGHSIPNYPPLRIKIGLYHPLERRSTEGIVPRMANQIWSYSQLNNVMAKSTSYGILQSKSRKNRMEIPAILLNQIILIIH